MFKNIWFVVWLITLCVGTFLVQPQTLLNSIGVVLLSVSGYFNFRALFEDE